MADEVMQLDLNRATVDALPQLPGIGPALAQRIVDARPFASVDDLVRVRGIGPETLQRLRPFVRVSEPEPVEEMDEMQEHETVLKSDQAGATPAEDAGAEAIEAKVPEIEALMAEPVKADEAPWEKEPIPGLDEEIPFMDEVPFMDEDIPFEEQEIPMPDEDIPVPEVARVAEAAPKPERPAVTRARVRWMALLSIVLATLLGTLLSLAILSFVNGGQLQFATPAQVGELSTRAGGLETQAGVLAQDVEGLRKRLDNLEALSGRLTVVEQAGEQMQADLKAADGEIDRLAAQARELATQSATLARQAEEVEARVSTLETQGSKAQAFLEGLADLMNTLFPPEASKP